MANAYDFSGRTALVTGGASGIGAAAAGRLRASGAEVAVFDREPVEGYISVTGDISSSADVNAAVAQVERDRRLASQRLGRRPEVLRADPACAHRLERELLEPEARRRVDEIGPPRAERIVGDRIEGHRRQLRVEPRNPTRRAKL